MVDAVEQRMGKTSKIGSEMPEIGHSLWSNSSTPTTIINTQSTSRSTIFSIGDNVLPISPDLQSTSSEMQPRSQQQFTRYSMGLSSLEKLKTNFRSAESHEKVTTSTTHLLSHESNYGQLYVEVDSILLPSPWNFMRS